MKTTTKIIATAILTMFISVPALASGTPFVDTLHITKSNEDCISLMNETKYHLIHDDGDTCEATEHGYTCIGHTSTGEPSRVEITCDKAVFNMKTFIIEDGDSLHVNVNG